MTNGMISISIQPTSRSLVAIFHLRPPIVFFISQLLQYAPLVPYMGILFWGQRNFPISYRIGILYIYCPVWRETRRFVPPWKFMSPEGDMNFLGGTNLRVSRLTGQLIVYYTESCSTTLYSAERCAVRHDRETRRLEGNTTICSPSTWLL